MRNYDDWKTTDPTELGRVEYVDVSIDDCARCHDAPATRRRLCFECWSESVSEPELCQSCEQPIELDADHYTDGRWACQNPAFEPRDGDDL